jgi:hypothetical protein
MYLYSAMADLADEFSDPTLLDACRHLWDEVTTKHLYLTGGIGAGIWGESFWGEYQVPNEQAYAETCAAIGLVFWNQRLLQLDCDGKYADVMERALYNGTISGISLDGKKFFYENPLASHGGHHRQDWFGCSCCPPNIARLIASLGDYIYSRTNDGLAVHLYVQGDVKTELADGTAVTLTQQTCYPWKGAVKIDVAPAAAYLASGSCSGEPSLEAPKLALRRPRHELFQGFEQRPAFVEHVIDLLGDRQVDAEPLRDLPRRLRRQITLGDGALRRDPRGRVDALRHLRAERAIA